jgi:hypothetical protein
VYDDSETIDLETVPLDGGILLKILAISIDPYFRGRMREAHVPSYMPAFPLHQPLTSLEVGVVVRSENENAKAGDHFVGFLPMKNYAVVKDVTGLTKIENTHQLPWTWYVSILGGTGKTAFKAWSEYSKAKKGETVYVTSGAGPVGSVVIQIAKSQGLKVIASAGSEEKVAFLKECGADVAFNYKTEDTKEVLKKEGPIQVFWDNVGGSQLEAALEAASNGARFIECGHIEAYNAAPYHIKNLFHIVSKGLTLNGFILGRDLGAKWEPEFKKGFTEKVAKGEFKIKEDVSRGLDKVGDAILAVQKGLNNGKAVVVLADE